MINKLKHTVKKGSDGLIKTVMVVGTTLFIMLNVGVHKTNAEVKKEIGELLKDKRYTDKEIVIQENNQKTEDTEKTAKFETVGDTTNALDYAVQNVDKYYPDMKEHLNTMINSFRDQEHRDSTTALLNKMVENIKDPKQKVGMIIGILEYSVFYKSIFGDKYGEIFTEDMFGYIENFDADYKARFKRYYDRLLVTIKTLEEKLEKSKQDLEKSEQDLEKSKQELEKNKQELEENINKFTPEDIKNNPGLKQLIINTETFYKENNFSIPENIQKLFEAAKK